MKKLAVMTAMVFLFGVAGIAVAFGPEVNNNDLVGAQTGGTAVNDSLASGNTTYANIPIANDEVKGGAAANDQSLAVNDSLNNNDIANDSVKGGAAANDQSIAVNDSLNNNDLFSNNETAAASKGGQATVDGNNTKIEDSFTKKTEDSFNKITEVEAEKGGQAANNGGTNVKQEAFLIKNEKHAAGESVTTVGATTTTTVGAGSINGSNSTYVAAGANNQAANAKYKSDNPEAEDGSQLLQGGGTQVLNKAEEGGIAGTGGDVTYNKAEDGGIVSTGTGAVTKQYVEDGGQLGTTNVQNKGKYAALNASQTINENNLEAEKGGIAAVGSVLTMEAKDGGIAAAPGSAVSKIELEGKVEHNDIRFDGKAISVTKSGEAKSVAVNDGKAESDEAKTGDAFSISKSKSKSGFAVSAALGKSKSGGNGAAALGGAISKSEANATGAASPFLNGNSPEVSRFPGSQFGQNQDPGDVEAESDESNALSVNVAVAKDGDSKNYSKADADSGSSESESEAESKTGSAYSTAANFGKAKSADANSGNANGAAARVNNSFTTGANTLNFAGSFNGVGTFNSNSGVNALNQSPISINAVVGGNVAGN